MPGTGTAATILVVDDDALISLGTADLIADMGLVAVEAYSGHEALAVLERGDRVDVLVTDYSMPGMTGIELAARARALRPGLPVLLATGYNELPGGAESDLPRLSKPFHFSELRAALLKAMEASVERDGV